MTIKWKGKKKKLSPPSPPTQKSDPFWEGRGKGEESRRLIKVMGSRAEKERSGEKDKGELLLIGD